MIVIAACILCVILVVLIWYAAFVAAPRNVDRDDYPSQYGDGEY